MSLASGTRLGPYEVLAPLGAGGMGEVYKARDTRLERTVALKVIPSHLAQDAELKQRLVREARAISSLTHPHICALYDIGSEDGLDYLVMEYLEGETLADRLAKGPLPPDLVLRFGREIAEALERAHKEGVVHRDLKPGNVMLTKSGVKLLDFGLAKLRVEAAEPALSHLPTRVASQPLTEKGTILGTFQYMSPEQLEGKEADARSDIFALGAVLHEMATGRKAFSGTSQASLIAAILASEPPPISTFQKMSPPALDRLVTTCLAKDPDERWQSAHDVAAELKWIAEGGSQVGAPAPVVARKRGRERLAWALVALVPAACALAWARSRPDPLDMPPVRFGVQVPGATALEPALSHDGRQLAFAAVDWSGRFSLRLRPLSGLAARELADTEGAKAPFFSPDDASIAFFSRGRLLRFALPSGPVTEVCAAPDGESGFFTPDGRIVFASTQGGLSVVPATGGAVQPLTTLETARDETEHVSPQLLPDGRRFLFTASRRGRKPTLVLGTLGAPDRRELPDLPARARFAAPGFLLFARGTQIAAQEIDPSSFAPRGEAFVVAEEARFPVAVRDTRALVYEAANVVATELAWFDRSGANRAALGTLKGYFFSLDLSPDGRRLAYEKTTGDARNIWVTDLARQTSSRLTFGSALDDSPVFSPDGSRIAFDSNQSGTWNIYTRSADGSGSDTLIAAPGADDVVVLDWSSDGRTLVYGVDRRNKTGWDIWAVTLGGDAKPFPFLATPFREMQARLSPDGRFLAYSSDESGRREVYAQRFPGGGGKVQLSPAGGTQPIWRRDGKELFFLSDDSRITAVPLTWGKDGFEAGAPVPLFEFRAPLRGDIPARNLYAVSSDGKRFLVNSAVERESPISLHVLLSWSKLRR